jgi:hypothetical protein
MTRFWGLVGLGVVISASGLQAGETPTPASSGAVVMEAPYYGDQGGACCGGRDCRGSCLHRVWDWLTYQPLYKPGYHDCCPYFGCKGCCDPPLYTFFPCQGCGGHVQAYGGCPQCGGGHSPPVTFGAPQAVQGQGGSNGVTAPPSYPAAASRQQSMNSFTDYGNRAWSLVSHHSQ